MTDGAGTARDPHDRVLLAIDTAIGTSVALGKVGADGAVGEILAAESDDPRGHVERIGALLAEMFERVPPARVTGVVVGIGPGPFTGLRVGIAAAHAFAQARGVPLLPLHGHEAVALEALEAGADWVRVVQDAKRRELFVTDYAGLDEAGIPVRTTGPRIEPRSGTEPVPHEVWPERIPAASLVRLAERRLAAGRDFAPDRALYLRQPDVAAPGAPKRVST